MPIRTLRLKIRFVVERDGEEFHAFCPDLKGVHVSGATETEAIEHGRQAVELYVLSMLKHDEPLPVGVVELDRTASLRALTREFIGQFLPARRHSHVEEICVHAAA